MHKAINYDVAVSFFDHISVVRGSILTFFTVLPTRIVLEKSFLMVAGVKMPGIGGPCFVLKH